MLQRKHITMVIVVQSFHNSWIPEKRKIANFDYENKVWQNVGVKTTRILFQVHYRCRDTIVGYLRIVKHDRAVLIQDFQAKLEVRDNSFIGMLAVELF